jgi:hypothetical protein
VSDPRPWCWPRCWSATVAPPSLAPQSPFVIVLILVHSTTAHPQVPLLLPPRPCKSYASYAHGTRLTRHLHHARSSPRTSAHGSCANALCGHVSCADALSSLATMISSGFTNAPVSRFLVFSTVITALLATLTDTRYYFHLQVQPHIWGYGQFWRFGVWPVRFCELLRAWIEE